MTQKFDYRKYIAENNFVVGDAKSKNFEDSVIPLNERVSIKDIDLKVGSKFELPNGETIEIKKKFIENTDEDWIQFIRAGGTGSQQGKNESSVKQIRQFLNRWKAKQIK